MISKEKKVIALVATVFGLGVVMIIGAIYIYSLASSAGDTEAFKKATKALEETTRLSKVLDGNVQSVSLCNKRVTAVESDIADVKEECKVKNFELDALTERSEKLKQAQIELQDKLSKKRPVITLHQPIGVEVVSQGMKSLIKESSKKVKGLNQ